LPVPEFDWNLDGCERRCPRCLAPISIQVSQRGTPRSGQPIAWWDAGVAAACLPLRGTPGRRFAAVQGRGELLPVPALGVRVFAVANHLSRFSSSRGPPGTPYCILRYLEESLSLSERISLGCTDCVELTGDATAMVVELERGMAQDSARRVPAGMAWG
jgi:hypothetical protein